MYRACALTGFILTKARFWWNCWGGGKGLGEEQRSILYSPHEMLGA